MPIASTNSTETPEHIHPTRNPYHPVQNPIPENIQTGPSISTHNNNYYTKNDLQNWLTQARISGQPPTTPAPDNTNPNTKKQPPDKPKQQKYHYTYQKTIQPHHDNHHWGDCPPLPKLQKLYCHIQKCQHDLHQPQSTTVVGDSTCTQQDQCEHSMPPRTQHQLESNDDCTDPASLPTTIWESQDHHIYSLQTTTSDYQLGGTATLSLGSSTSRLITMHEDPHGLGWWTAIALQGRSNKTLLFVSAYCVCNQSVSIGSQTAYTQQHTQLTIAGYVDPDPWEIFVDDLLTQLKKWKQQQYEVLLCMDANKNMNRLSPTQGIGHILHETGLIDLPKHRQPRCPTPPTYNCSTTTIDTCLGMQLFAQVLTAA